MPPPVICVENLSKRYLVGHRAERNRNPGHTNLRDVIGRELRNTARKAADIARGRQLVQGDAVEEFWALRGVSFTVNEGEVVGIIGRNGAGKSTLLKILSRITEPTAGRITLRGRIASLLEVGTGFHPELTGRENIYLNGAILGMSRAEIRRKFDEIVAFAEVEKFLDTPVKRYSSGMYVRLAFAVAAHLEPEILIVDEVLAVGDSEFQKKCLGKMDDISRREGRTVLFVSHNLAAIAELASRAILLNGGAVVIDGEVSHALSAYMSKAATRASYVTPHDESHEPPHVVKAEVLTSHPNGVQYPSEPLQINVWIQHRRPLVQACLGIQIINQFRVSACAVYAYPPDHIFGRDPGTTLIEFHIPKVRLNLGQFNLRIWLTGAEPYETLDGVCDFEVIRLDKGIVRTWSADACTYREEFSLKITKEIATTTTKLLRPAIVSDETNDMALQTTGPSAGRSATTS
ncbi:MAG: polysaccharide ABC transporter ATP-binding protein [Stellaceae bacterium]